ncbi:TPA: hypothetical protein HA344_09980 [Candidatus Bathyarchaeota archaeon]|nr:hypothetical protein [Candidatus Bathyarchaeota archaeon]
MSVVQTASTIQLLGAAGFGTIVGWYVYYINRYRKGDVQFNDLVTLIGIIGGGTVLTLFPASTDLFGAYGVGLAVGFFGYFITLCIMVSMTDKFSVDWFLDGRRKIPADDEIIPKGTAVTVVAMGKEAMGKEIVQEEEVK